MFFVVRFVIIDVIFNVFVMSFLDGSILEWNVKFLVKFLVGKLKFV